MTAERRAGRVPREVLEFFDEREIRPSFSHADVWREEHRVAFAVAKAVEVDLIEDMRAAVREAIEQGIPFEQFRREITPTLQRKGWWGEREVTDPITGERAPAQLGSPRRLKTIYETNIRTARSAGQWARIERTKRALPYLQYNLGPSEKHRDEHAALDGQIYRVDDPFWNFWMPINGYGCKCWVAQMTRERAESEGGPHTPPGETLELVESTNPRTGQKVQHPVGVQPTFAYNPGKDRFAGLRQAGIVK